jgi:iron complex transport system permease protein
VTAPAAGGAAGPADTTGRTATPDTTSRTATPDTTSRTATPDTTSRTATPDTTSRTATPDTTSRTGTAGAAIPAAAATPDPALARVRPGRPIAVATVLLLAAMIIGVSVGPADLSLPAVVEALLVRLPWHPAMSVPNLNSVIVWQIRLPRVILGALVGAMLAGGGAAYQGVFRNPLADPYLLGVAAGGGLGATMIIVTGGSPGLLPPAAFAGALCAVALTYLLGAGPGRGGESPGSGAATASIVLAGVAVAALLTAVQTYLQQQHAQTLQVVYSWILGELSLASWSDVTLILPYAVLSAVLLITHRRLLDVLRVGETEAGSLGVNVARLRLTVVLAATLGTAAAVAVSGLIGFVGIIVPHTVRLTAGASYRIVLPVSMIGGAAFLVLADVVARTVQAPAEVPIGVITAAAGAPFFLFVLRSRRSRRDLS